MGKLIHGGFLLFIAANIEDGISIRNVSILVVNKLKLTGVVQTGNTGAVCAVE